LKGKKQRLLRKIKSLKRFKGLPLARLDMLADKASEKASNNDGADDHRGEAGIFCQIEASN